MNQKVMLDENADVAIPPPTWYEFSFQQNNMCHFPGFHIVHPCCALLLCCAVLMLSCPLFVLFGIVCRLTCRFVSCFFRSVFLTTCGTIFRVCFSETFMQQSFKAYYWRHSCGRFQVGCTLTQARWMFAGRTRFFGRFWHINDRLGVYIYIYIHMKPHNLSTILQPYSTR